MKIYFYKLTVDDGGAPCVRDGMLSLAICKPFIRSTAEPGDMIFGFAGSSLRRDKALLYVAKVTDKCRDGLYYTQKEFARRDDRIYTRCAGAFVWRRGAKYHGERDAKHDLGVGPQYTRANVLLSRDFRYFGRSASDDYRARFPRIAEAVDALRQGHRVWHSAKLRDDFAALQEHVWAAAPSTSGQPMSSPQGGVCHRGRTCGEAC